MSEQHNMKISYTETIPDLLKKLKCTIAVSTYHVGKVIFICPLSTTQLLQIPKHFKKPMGIAVSGDKLAVASINKVTVFSNSPKLAINYPIKPKTFDALFMPRADYYCGRIDVHDLNWGKDGLWAVNTGFSCLSIIDDNHSFTPKWQPPFITDLMPEDRCHLNGLAMKNGYPAYVTALSQTNTKEGWRSNLASSGILMDVKTEDILLDQLPVPHSPRLIDGHIYFLLSGTGELVKYNLETKSYESVQLPGFARGMAEYGNYLFIGLSKIRKSSKSFQALPVKSKAKYAGVVVLYKPTLSIVGEIRYEDTVEEIYDVQILPNLLRPSIVNPENEIHERSLSAPGLNFWGRPK
jgi:uncharacterized protein (TIGR03032 family)